MAEYVGEAVHDSTWPIHDRAWQYMAVHAPNSVWQYMAVRDNTRQYVALHGITCQYKSVRGSHGNTWQYMYSSWQNIAVHGRI